MKNPFRLLTVKEWLLWGFSLCAVTIANIAGGSIEWLTLIAAWVGVTSLIYAAKGHMLGPYLMIVFSVLYGIISYRCRYWGEMITYLGMTLPMSIWAAVTWYHNPSKEDAEVVRIHHMRKEQIVVLSIVTIVVTGLFYSVLKALDTPNLLFSTVSVTTSFIAAALTMYRSLWYPFFYGLNDIVLIVLWVLMSLKNPVYICVTVNFIIFLINDFYGFISWRKRAAR